MSAPILITGVGKRLGLCLAHHLLDQNHEVIGTYRSEYESLDVLRERGAILYQCDFCDDVQVHELLCHIQRRFSNLRAIIHNASDWLADDGDLSHRETFQRMMGVHAETPYRFNLTLRPLLEANKDGCSDIIHITDYVAERGSKKHIAYAASKAALENMTLSFSALMAPKVKVNSISPAMIAFNPEDDAHYRNKALSKSLMGIEPGFREIENAIDYLLSSNYVTGRSISVDGGRHLKTG